MSTPWRTLRCVVEVKVPPSNRSDEKDLIHQVRQQLDSHLAMPRPLDPNHHASRPEVKSFVRVVAYHRPVGKPYEQLVIRLLYAILTFTMPRTRMAREASKMLVEDTRDFLGVGK